jgi:hypothetical protein
MTFNEMRDELECDESPVGLKELARELVICGNCLFVLLMSKTWQCVKDFANHDWKKEFQHIYQSNKKPLVEFGWFLYYLFLLPYMMVYVAGEMCVLGLWNRVLRRKPIPTMA